MNKTLIGCGIFLVLGLVIVLILGIFFVTTMNKETRLRNQITAKQTDNTSEYDNLWKKLSQSAQVTDAQKEALREIIVGNAQARKSGGGSLATMVHEAVPTVDTSTFNNLLNIVTSSRDAWTMRQKELIDLKREHDNIIDLFPSNLICMVLGRQKIDIKIVTSSRTGEAFKTGKDDDVDLFNRKKETKVEKGN
jgi:hypothetical protein